MEGYTLAEAINGNHRKENQTVDALGAEIHVMKLFFLKAKES